MQAVLSVPGFALEMRPVKIALFDFDGTIVDSRQAMRQVIRTLSREYGIRDVSDEEILKLRDLPIRERMKILGISRFKLPRIAGKSLTLLGEFMEECEIYDGILRTLQELRSRGIQTMILSSNRVDNIERCLERNGLAGFDHIYSVRYLFGKHRSLKRIMRIHNVSANEIVYIGDELRDIEASRRAGVPVISVTWGYDSRDLLKSGNPDYLAESPSEIANFILD